MGRDFLFSPCPNDIFLFWPWVSRWSQASYCPTYEVLDIGQLNERARLGQPKLLKLSVATYLGVQDMYKMLPVGAAFAYHEGPKLVAPVGAWKGEPPRSALVPGLNTTAASVMRVLFPECELIPAHYAEIPQRLRAQQQCASGFGVLVNESRGNLESQGLVEVCDLGALWRDKTGHILPLGCLAIRRDCEEHSEEVVSAVLQSYQMAKAHPDRIEAIMLAHSLEKDPKVCWDHVRRYVTEDTLQMSPEAEAALDFFSRS